jgi:hypothetical protein
MNTGVNYYKLAVEKDRDSIVTTIWKPGFEPKVVIFTAPNTFIQNLRTLIKI